MLQSWAGNATNYYLGAVYTFGSPRVGNGTFADAYKALGLWNYTLRWAPPNGAGGRAAGGAALLAPVAPAAMLSHFVEAVSTRCPSPPTLQVCVLQRRVPHHPPEFHPQVSGLSAPAHA